MRKPERVTPIHLGSRSSRCFYSLVSTVAFAGAGGTVPDGSPSNPVSAGLLRMPFRWPRAAGNVPSQRTPVPYPPAR